MKAPLKRLSICPCGDTILREEIGLGHEYDIFPDRIEEGYYFHCGACGQSRNDVRIVYASQGDGLPPMPLPLELFEDVPGTFQNLEWRERG